MKLSVVSACLNEKENLQRFPKEVVDVLRPLVSELELVLIDDGSTDPTHDEMLKIKNTFQPTVIVQNNRNRGLGAALKSGFQKASGDAILTLDADLTFHPRDFNVLLNAFTENVDCVMGSPFQGEMKNVNFFRKFLSWGVNSIYRILLGRDVTSVSSIFRLYRTSRLKSFELSCDAFDINAEILFKMIVSGAGVVEVPVTLGRRLHGVSKINFLREIKNHVKMFLKIMAWKIKN